MLLIMLKSWLSLARNFTQRPGRTLLPLHIPLIFSVFPQSPSLRLWFLNLKGWWWLKIHSLSPTNSAEEQDFGWVKVGSPGMGQDCPGIGLWMPVCVLWSHVHKGNCQICKSNDMQWSKEQSVVVRATLVPTYRGRVEWPPDILL